MRPALAAAMLLAVLPDLSGHSARTRRVETWTYDELFKAADLVVIASATGSKDTGEKTKLGGWQIEFLNVNTTFEVKSTLKGKAPDKKITVLHFRLPDDTDIADGPGFVSFRDKDVNFELKGGKYGLPAPDYMLFLKASKNPKETRYEPVSGRVDPDQSVRELFPPGLANNLAGDQK